MTDFEDRCAERLNELMQEGGDVQVNPATGMPFDVTEGGGRARDESLDTFYAAPRHLMFTVNASGTASDPGSRKRRAERKIERQNRRRGRANGRG